MVLENLPEMIASSEEKKKSSKPLMEKRRRARINQSLNELKNLILEALNKDTSCYSKLEKADILEMTVSYLRSLKRQQLTAAPASPDPSALAKYRAGFNECASEVSRYLMSLNGMDTQVRSTLLAHLADCCNPVKSSSQETDRIQSLPQQYSPLAFGPANGPLFSPTYAKPASDTSILNGATQFQIVPGQLANGKIAAVLVPASAPTSATIVQAAPQIIPVFRPDFRTPQAFQLQGQALRADTDPLWRPW